MEQYIHKWLLFSAGAITAYMSDIIGIVILFLILFIADFVTGCVASFLTGNKIESYRLRWSLSRHSAISGHLSSRSSPVCVSTNCRSSLTS